LFDKNVIIYGRSNMCQFEYEGKQIKLLPLRLKTGQPNQTFTLTLLPILPSPPLIVTAPSLSPTSHTTLSANHFLSYCRHHLIIEHSNLHLYSHHRNTCINYTKRSVIEINRVTRSLLYELTIEKY